MNNTKSRMKSNRMTKILHELIRNSSRSDHEIAKVVGVSQPTVTRLRNQLEKEDHNKRVYNNTRSNQNGLFNYGHFLYKI